MVDCPYKLLEISNVQNCRHMKASLELLKNAVTYGHLPMIIGTYFASTASIEILAIYFNISIVSNTIE